MNFVTSVLRTLRAPRMRIISDSLLILLLSIGLAGCGDRVQLPSQDQLLEFENAGPPRPVVDVDRLMRAKVGGGPYRIVPDDVLELTMPTILTVVTAEESDVSGQTVPYICRVGNEGRITLPAADEIEAGGKTLAEIEATVIEAYYPKYTVTRPSVFARVLEYKTAKVSITGAVQKPGIYPLRSDEMSLVALIMQAEGIIDEGAALIRIARAAETTQSEGRPVQSAPAPAIDEAPRAEDRNSTTVRAAEELLKSNARKRLLLGPRSVSSEQIKVQLLFQRSDSKSTNGALLVRYDGKTLRFKNFDVESDLHKQALLKHLANRDRRFSTVALEPELIGLAEELRTIISLESELAELVKDLRSNPAPDDAIDRQSIESLGSAADTGNGHTAKSPTGEPEPLILPVKGLNIPFADVALQDGDAVIVERFEPPLVTVMGLVQKPGNFPYPPDARYNLMQAIGFAGGFNQAADPRYVTVYRMKPDRTIVHAIFSLVEGSRMTEALGILIKPGDIVAVEHTPRTRKNVFLDKVFRINMGTYVRLDDLWGSSD